MGEYLEGLIKGLFGCYQSSSKERRELALSKLEALSNLLIENRIYLRDYSHKELKDQEKETALAMEWKRVGALFHPDSVELARICEYKSDYWVHPDFYSKEKVKELDISIRSLEGQYQRIKEELL
ncbi:hypothetical protein [Serratia fonticola]|uniref:Uncharacterized protein n=1 Tax=Serratia fonticola TaxID=47917 RepID=A0AAW3WSG5_SERFO|nr:hypothetical protein [Serratia fonticola]MBC3213853.1 hypothetical protein [Serratia fonticola]NYA13126.1 hypothetical protein [Serratia fonticola]NYA33453.1 hypothetical protein [Serratia fonticola]